MDESIWRNDYGTRGGDVVPHNFVRFKVVDKKVAKRTAQQETYIEPVRALNELRRIEGKGEGTHRLCFPQGGHPR